VITGNDGVKLTTGGAAKNGVAWKRPFDIDPSASRVINGGAQDRFVLGTK